MQHIRHYFSLHVSTRHTFCFYIIYLELGFDKIYVAVLNYLKVSQPQNFDIFFIALLKYSNVYEYFDVKMSNIRAREVDEFSAENGVSPAKYFRCHVLCL